MATSRERFVSSSRKISTVPTRAGLFHHRTPFTNDHLHKVLTTDLIEKSPKACSRQKATFREGVPGLGASFDLVWGPKITYGLPITLELLRVPLKSRRVIRDFCL
jgi:hypothetical protein